MSLPPFTKTLAEKKLAEFCDKRVPLHIRNKVKLIYKFRGKAVTIIESREPWREDMTEWTECPIAQIRYNEKSNKWKLYYADRSNRWHPYFNYEAEIDAVLEALDKDKTGIFGG